VIDHIRDLERRINRLEESPRSEEDYYIEIEAKIAAIRPTPEQMEAASAENQRRYEKAAAKAETEATRKARPYVWLGKQLGKSYLWLAGKLGHLATSIRG